MSDRYYFTQVIRSRGARYVLRSWVDVEHLARVLEAKGR